MAAQDDEARMVEALTQVRVEQVLVQVLSELISIGLAKAGAIPEAPEAADADQARLAIEAIAGIGGLLDGRLPPEGMNEIRQALAQLQMLYVRMVEQQGGVVGEPAGTPPRPTGERPPAPQPPPAQQPPRPKIWTPRGDV